MPRVSVHQRKIPPDEAEMRRHNSVPRWEDEMECLTRYSYIKQGCSLDCKEEEIQNTSGSAPPGRGGEKEPRTIWMALTSCTAAPALDLCKSDVTGTTQRGRLEIRLTGSDDEFGTVCCDTWTDTGATADRSKRNTMAHVQMCDFRYHLELRGENTMYRLSKAEQEEQNGNFHISWFSDQAAIDFEGGNCCYRVESSVPTVSYQLGLSVGGALGLGRRAGGAQCVMPIGMTRPQSYFVASWNRVAWLGSLGY
ncbi:hypothetical protein DPMN_047309 [Dreissena polymorpha]|uniref:SRCR domain-containing protein n=1 Tax=Dreissena polymorpha TaxID=45954 RepID=A0A9D4I1D2_DREPO|nr:hypothetical protein DPMN_047309 [Dreissena polymorpha]